MDINATAEDVNGQGGAPQQEAPAQPQITNLDSLSEFEFQGEKYTPSRLQEVFQGYQSLSKEADSYKRYKDYALNIDHDIENVIEGRASADKFKSIYPQEFHEKLERALQAKQGTQNQLPRDVLNRLSKVDSIEQRLEAIAIENANAKLDALIPKLMEKHPLANEDMVYAKAEAFLSQGGKLTDAVWERFAKESHDSINKRAEAFYKKQLKAQTDKGEAGKDAGPGGTPPGKAPVKPRTFQEAQDAMIAELKSKGYR